MLSFVGLNLVFDKDALNPTPTNLIGINDVTLKNGIIQHFNVTKNVTDAWSGVIPNQWVTDTIMDADFVGTVAAGNVDYVTSQLSSVLVKRKEADNINSPWVTLFKIPVLSSESLSFTVTDFFNQSNVNYVYSLVPVLIQEQSGVNVMVEGNYETSDTVLSNFDGVFICNRDAFYRLYAGANYGSLQTIQEIGVHTTLGSTYPIVVTNSKAGYHTGSVGGTLVPSDFEANGNLDRLDIVKRRETLDKFLIDKKPKILKDGNGNIWLIIFTDNVDVSFDNNWGMGIGNISSGWTEIGDAKNPDDLDAAGLIDIGGGV